MVTFLIVSTKLTTTQSATETIYVAPTGSILTLISAAIVSAVSSGDSYVIDGTVAATGSNAIVLDYIEHSGYGGHSISVGTTGLVASSTNNAIWLSGTNSSVLNAGQITAIDYGIYNHDSDFVLENAGIISSARSEAVRSESQNARITNTGSIFGRENGIRFGSGDHSQLSNPGHISGGLSAVVSTNSSYLTAINSGTLSSSTGYVVEFDGGVSNKLTNSGTVQGNSGVLLTGSGCKVFNSGSILGDTLGVLIENSSAGVVNLGKITAVGNALQIDGDGTRVRNGLDGHIASSNATGVSLSGKLASITNAGDISGEATGFSFLGDGCYLRNTGSITGLSWAFGAFNNGNIGFNEVSIINAGTLSGSNNAIIVNDQTFRLDNSGAVTAQGGSAILCTSKAIITNTGTIAGGTAFTADGKALELGAASDIVRNFGTLHGDAQLGGGNDLVRNGGWIDGSVILADGNDTFNGRGGTVEGVVSGGAGNDSLRGGAGDDLLSAGTGLDTLTGGGGADVFIFAKALEVSSGNARDHITDFAAGSDKIDLSGFMAGGHFIGAALFGKVADQVRYVQATGTLSGDVNGDGKVDWTLILDNHAVVTAGDFLF